MKYILSDDVKLYREINTEEDILMLQMNLSIIVCWPVGHKIGYVVHKFYLIY